MVPVIAVTSGEPAGIGPELCLTLPRLLANAAMGEKESFRVVVLGDRELLAARARQTGIDMRFCSWPDSAPGALSVLHCPLAVPVEAGKLDRANASYVLALLDRALAGCMSGEFAAMVTAPVHKGVINEAGIPFTGHTEYLAEKTGTARVVMMLAGETERYGEQGEEKGRKKGGKKDESGVPSRYSLRVALATTHLPLKDVAAAITAPLLEESLRIVHAELVRRFGLDAPRILVTGLNPHAGEGGYLGREEIDVITPVLEKLRAEGMALIGPLPADTMFTPPVLAGGDCVFAMYHDQGLTALKYATFGHGINVTLGLPVIRTSVDHGTALELAGTGRADPGSLIEAVRQALFMARRVR